MLAPRPFERIAAAKLRLRARIAARRRRCVTLSARVAAPLGWLDQAERWWHALGPLGKIGGTAAALWAWRWARRSDAAAGAEARHGWWGEVFRWVVTRAAERTLP